MVISSAGSRRSEAQGSCVVSEENVLIDFVDVLRAKEVFFGALGFVTCSLSQNSLFRMKFLHHLSQNFSSIVDDKNNSVEE